MRFSTFSDLSAVQIVYPFDDTVSLKNTDLVYTGGLNISQIPAFSGLKDFKNANNTPLFLTQEQLISDILTISQPISTVYPFVLTTPVFSFNRLNTYWLDNETNLYAGCSGFIYGVGLSSNILTDPRAQFEIEFLNESELRIYRYRYNANTLQYQRDLAINDGVGILPLTKEV